jgi:hypothetical protein
MPLLETTKPHADCGQREDFEGIDLLRLAQGEFCGIELFQLPKALIMRLPMTPLSKRHLLTNY